VLGAGRLRTDEEEERRERSGEKGRQLFSPEWKRTPEEVKLSHALEKVAKEIGAKSITAGACSVLTQVLLIQFFDVQLPLHMSCTKPRTSSQ
jgi:hypothetical protein